MERIEIKILCGKPPPPPFILKIKTWDVLLLAFISKVLFFDRVPQKVLSRRNESVVNLAL